MINKRDLQKPKARNSDFSRPHRETRLRCLGHSVYVPHSPKALASIPRVHRAAALLARLSGAGLDVDGPAPDGVAGGAGGMVAHGGGGRACVMGNGGNEPEGFVLSHPKGSAVQRELDRD